MQSDYKLAPQWLGKNIFNFSGDNRELIKLDDSICEKFEMKNEMKYEMKNEKKYVRCIFCDIIFDQYEIIEHIHDDSIYEDSRLLKELDDTIYENFEFQYEKKYVKCIFCNIILDQFEVYNHLYDMDHIEAIDEFNSFINFYKQRYKDILG